MILSPKTLEKLRLLINEQTEYRSGPEIVRFFNQLGFDDSYGQGFPSRWVYTDDRLAKLNGTPEMDKCIKTVLSPANFIGRAGELDAHISDFNQFLVFDRWKLVRNKAELSFRKLAEIEFDESSPSVSTEDEFLKREFSDIPIIELGFEGAVSDVLEYRIKEIEKCYLAEAPLAVILLAGSTLEGILLGMALKHPKKFNTSRTSPKDKNGKVKLFQEWSLSSFIDVARELELIKVDTHKFSHALRDFRNYVHPYEQIVSGFAPRLKTAKICLQVLKAAIHEIHENINRIGT
ncbi:MAG: hypothetical protein R6V76_06775 [Desulfobacterales bacterium]